MLQVPTDNFYKFCAISGLIACGLTLYFLTTEIFSTSDRINEEELKVKILDKEIEHNSEDIGWYEENYSQVVERSSRLESEISRIEKLVLPKEASLESAIEEERGYGPQVREDVLEIKLELESAIADYRKLIESREGLVEARRKIEIQVLERAHSVSTLGDLTERLSSLFWFSVPVLIAGFIMSAFGFAMWYKNVQEPQDRILEKQRQGYDS